MASVRSSGFYNNPAFAQAASNLASLFEPPSGADAAGWAAANAKKAEASRLQQFFDYRTAPDFDQQQFDRMGVAAGAYTPNQSYYNVDQGNATTRRGQDVTAATSRSNNAADNSRALETNRLSELGKLFQPLNEGQVRPGLHADIAGQFGVAHDLPAAQGRDKPMSETEVQGGLVQKMRDAGLITDDMITDRYVGDKTPVEAVGPDGKPIYMSPGGAVRAGATPYDAPKGGGMSITQPDGTTITMGGPGGKPTEGQGKAAYAGDMSTDPTIALLHAYDEGALPTGADYQLNQARKILPDAAAPLIAPNMSDPGQLFYQNLSVVLPYQLMAQSGLAVTEQEYTRKMRELVPVPGESAQVTAAKRAQLETYLEAVSRLAGPSGGPIAQALEAYRSGKTAPADAAAPPAAPKVRRFNPTTGKIE